MQLLSSIVSTNSRSLQDIGKTLACLVAQDYTRRTDYEDDYRYPPQVSMIIPR
jgi:hypothetical protein